MISEELSEKIHALVEHLRETDDAHVRLVDVASVTEVLIGTMQAYFRSIDTSIYREFASISAAIEKTRQEISQLQPKDLERVHIPRAGQELDAIVQATESATETIMEAAEEIMAVDGIDAQAEAACMRIFEACSFQDITGQRISKVVTTLNQIEERIARFKSLWGVEDIHDEGADADVPVGRMDGDVRLEGPALEGEGIDQSAVDALMSGDIETEAADTEPDADAASQSEPEPEAEPEPEPEPAAAEEQPAAKPSKTKAKAKKKPATKKPAAEKKPAKAKTPAADKKPAAAKKADKTAKSDDASDARTADARTAKTAAPEAAEDKPATADAPAREVAAPAADDQSDADGEEATQDEIDALFA